MHSPEGDVCLRRLGDRRNMRIVSSDGYAAHICQHPLCYLLRYRYETTRLPLDEEPLCP